MGEIVTSHRMRIDGLDALRGIAIGLVLIRHAYPNTFGGAGVVGVAIFFALSGYLITGLLRADLEGPAGRVRYGRFYRNRAFRLFPALIALLGIYWVVEFTNNFFFDAGYLSDSILYGITYTSNLPFVTMISAGLGHLWTLATEEQFYLVWPIVLTVAFAMRRVGLIVALAAVIIMAACAWEVLSHTRPELALVYRYPTSWAIVLLIGSAARIWSAQLGRLWSISIVRRSALVLSVVVLAVLCVQPNLKLEPVTYFVFAPLIGACTVVLIFRLRDIRVATGPALRLATALGTISYATYLWNYPTVLVLHVSWIKHGWGMGWAEPLVGIVLSIALAIASWVFVEQPFNRIRKRLDARVAAPSEVRQPQLA